MLCIQHSIEFPVIIFFFGDFSFYGTGINTILVYVTVEPLTTSDPIMVLLIIHPIDSISGV